MQNTVTIVRVPPSSQEIRVAGILRRIMRQDTPLSRCIRRLEVVDGY
jgi:hypothetical protein